jgi:hypothetical protein
MPIAIYSAKPGTHGLCGIIHVFFGQTEAAARQAMEDHADICPKYGPAYREGKTIEVIAEIDEIPAFDERSIEEFADVSDEDDGEEEEHTPW